MPLENYPLQGVAAAAIGVSTAKLMDTTHEKELYYKQVNDLKETGIPGEYVEEFEATWGTTHHANLYFSTHLSAAMVKEMKREGERDLEGISRFCFLEKHVPKFLRWCNASK